MKKGLTMLIALSMILCLFSGCGGTQKPTASDPADSSDGNTAELNWPSATIYFDVAAKAGGGTDLTTRYLTAGWQEYLEANFVVTNYETSEVGAQNTKFAAPDGHTLTLVSCTLMDNYLSGSSEVNPMEDYTCIAKVTSATPPALFTAPDAPYSNLNELKEYIEENPGEVIVGVALGGTSHLFWINMFKSMGISLDDVVFVQCGSEADKLTNVASGAIHLGNGAISNCQVYEADNKLKVIGTVSYSDTVGKDEIMEGLGEQYLTTWEQGFMGASWDTGAYVCGPAGMDPALVELINESLQKVGETKAFSEDMATPIDTRNVAETQDEYLREWEMQRELTTLAGVNIRD